MSDEPGNATTCGRREIRRNRTHRSRLGTHHHFTPRRWAVWLAETSRALDVWLDGGTVLDPTCGGGGLLFGLVAAAVRRGRPARELPLRRLYGVEREPTHLRALVRDCRREFGVEFPRENLHCADVLLAPPRLRVDALLGNPPWANFADLPAAEKDALKPLFVRYGLAGDRRRLLLGGSRVDVAALVVAKSIADQLRAGGSAAYFLPLSLLTGDGAHAGFRRYDSFAVTAVFDFAAVEVFPGVSTRYGAVLFRRDAAPSWPIPWTNMGLSVSRPAAPINGADGPLAIAEDATALDRLRALPRVVVPNGNRPRQGVNPCGSSKVFFVRDVKALNDELAESSSAVVGRVVLPRRFLFPLLTADQFSDADVPPRRWVLLPHSSMTGRPLTPEQVAEAPALADYLDRCRSLLENRRGRWLGRWIDRGLWWALLGVGAYCFTPYRVAWPAYGAARFTPRVFASPWQGQQALHAHIPCASRHDAMTLRTALARPEVEEYLQAFGTAGTRNFAQPGRVARLLVQTSSQTIT